MKALESGVFFNDEWSLCVQGTHCTHKGIRKSHLTMLSFGEMETHKEFSKHIGAHPTPHMMVLTSPHIPPDATHLLTPS